MGLLSEGKPFSWADTKKNAGHVHRVGIKQFLALYHRLKDRKGDVLKWGDEVKKRAFLQHIIFKNLHFVCYIDRVYAGYYG